MTFATLMTEITTGVSAFVPDLSVFIAAGAAVSLIVLGAKRLLKAGR